MKSPLFPIDSSCFILLIKRRLFFLGVTHELYVLWVAVCMIVFSVSYFLFQEVSIRLEGQKDECLSQLKENEMYDYGHA